MLLSEGIKGEGNILTQLLTKAVECVLQEALEQEQTEYLGRYHYRSRRGEDPHHGYRSGDKLKRLKTTEALEKIEDI